MYYIIYTYKIQPQKKSRKYEYLTLYTCEKCILVYVSDYYIDISSMKKKHKIKKTNKKKRYIPVCCMYIVKIIRVLYHHGDELKFSSIYIIDIINIISRIK